MLPLPVIAKLKEEFEARSGCEVNIHSQSTIGGGCINNALRVNTSRGPIFLKYNQAAAFPGMFESEAVGLKTLSSAQAIKIPEVLFTGAIEGYSFIVLEYIEQGARTDGFWDFFGSSLAALHRNSQASFGLQTDNYIGSLAQSNREHSDWIEFFILERLEPMIRMARDGHRIRPEVVARFQRLFPKLQHLIPEEPPSLLHGDLWSGNFLVGKESEPVLIDPAVYYGHREMDLAMTRLFGGFHPDFYSAYQSAFSMEKEWEKRMDLCNLYPLLVHVNLFGGGYASEVEHILSQFV